MRRTVGVRVAHKKASCVYVACREYDYHRLATREVVGLKRFEPLWGLSPPTNPVFPKANPNVKSQCCGQKGSVRA